MLRLSFVSLLVGWMLLGSGCVPEGSGPGAKKLQGNAQKVERGLFQKGSGGGFGVEDLYTYNDPTDATYYPNAFRMSQGRIIAINLQAKIVSSGNFAGDQVHIANMTDIRNIRWSVIELGQSGYTRIVDDLFLARIRRLGNDDYVEVTDGSATAIVSVNSLYRWRVQHSTRSRNIGDKEYKFLVQGGSKAAIVWFAPKATIAAIDPEATRADLSPSFVVAIKTVEGTLVGDHPLGSSGYIMRVKPGDSWDVLLAK